MSRAFRSGLSVLLVLLWVLPSRATELPALDFAVIGDPQIGYGRGGVFADARRFGLLLAKLDEAGVPLVVIPGDLVQDRSLVEHWVFRSTLSKLKAKALLVPGNHDVVDVSSLEDYRLRYGKDYYVEQAPSAKLVIVNSETARSSDISRSEYERQWEFLERELPTISGSPTLPTFVVMHRPPFVETEDEKESGSNWPRETRIRLLSLVRRAGVLAIFAGHLHRNWQTTTHDGIDIRVLCGSARCFDQSPISYTRYQGASVRTVRTAPFPPPPVSVPYLREWTPRLFDFSVRHWFFTLLYAACGWSAWRTARAESGTRASPFSWLAVLLFFFALNMQLDFDEMLREVGRVTARLTGVLALRHTLSLVVLGVAASVAAWLGLRRFRQGITRREIVALLASLVPCAWFALSTISHHDLRMVLDELVWDVLTLLAVLAVAWASVTQLRKRHPR